MQLIYGKLRFSLQIECRNIRQNGIDNDFSIYISHCNIILFKPKAEVGIYNLTEIDIRIVLENVRSTFDLKIVYSNMLSSFNFV